MEEIIRKILLYYVALVTKANDEVSDAEMGIYLHHMPKDWPTANFYHWFRLEMRFLRDSGAKPACKNDRFQDLGLIKR